MASSKALLLLFALISISVLAHEGDSEIKCTHDQHTHEPPQILEDIKVENYPPPEGRLLGSSSYPQIRIYADYEFLDSAPSTYKAYVQDELVPPVVSYFQAALKVKYPVSGNLKVPSYTTSVCGYRTPSILLSGGVPADYFIFYDSTYDSSSAWVGDSVVCYMAQDTNRPLVVTTKLNRALLTDPAGDVLLHEKNTYLVMHEMTHVFGFTYTMYPYFVDEYGNTLKGHVTSQRFDGGVSYVVNVPPLTQKLRNHFGCASLAGAYMENDGSAAATAGSHFERRMFINEYMTSGLTYQQRISEFSFAMLEGTGWYIPDYDYAEPYYFGRGQGCGFLFDSCSTVNSMYGEFCNNNGLGCTPIGRGGGNCLIDSRSDGCKYYHANIDYDCENPAAVNNGVLPDLQVYGRGAGSQCFSGDLSYTGRSSRQNTFCFKYSCTGSGTNTVLNVQVGSQTVACTEQGERQVSGFQGTINCPDPLYFCSTVGKKFCPRNCMGRGYCENGECVCYKGFQGTDCGLNI